MENLKWHCCSRLGSTKALGLARQSGLAHMAFWPTTEEQGSSFLSSAPAACRQNPVGRRPVDGGGVAEEQAQLMVNPIWGEGWWGAHRSGQPAVRIAVEGETCRRRGQRVAGGGLWVEEYQWTTRKLSKAVAWSEEDGGYLTMVSSTRKKTRPLNSVARLR
jgi:flavin-dependent dehydrogenase